MDAMRRTLRWVIPLILVAVIVAGLAVLANRTVRLHVDGETQVVKGWLWNSAAVLRKAGVALHPGDRVDPPVTARLPGEVTVQRATPGLVIDGDQTFPFYTLNKRPDSILAEVSIQLEEGDQVLWNGKSVITNKELPEWGFYILQIKRAKQLTITEDGLQNVINTTAQTVAEALWDAGIQLTPEDRLSVMLITPIATGLEVNIDRAREVSITLGGKTITVRSAAATVGEALAEGGLALQGLDYSVPPETEPLPASREVRIVQIREEVILDQKLIPFEKEVQPDDRGELDSWRVVDPGQEGILVTRVRVRYEDGVETARQVEGEWQAQAPRNQVTGYGTQAVVKTEEVDGEVIEYWRKITVYATSYSPCTSGASRCYPNTASGLPVQRGVIGVIRSWYNMMAGQPVYIPGYGHAIIADIGGGVAGVNWIDLGFSDADYVPYYWNVTLYFLTPIPAYYPVLLP